MYRSKINNGLYSFLVLVGIAAILYCHPDPVSALSVDQSCAPIETVFARGSGGDGATDGASIKFLDSLKSDLRSLGVPYHNYDLGSESYDGHKYPHIAINGSDGWYHGVGAWLTSGEGRAYGKSVHEGESELKEYLTERMQFDKCSDSKYILGGFSQGAQVIGETLSQLTEIQRAKVAYVALFGDPTLNLPEGATSRATDADGVPIPDACLGINLSAWRHTIDNCFAYSGELDARTPYVPNDMKDKVHDWCYKDDGICDNSQPLNGSGHNYTDETGISTAVSEALFTTGIIPDGSLINLSDPSIKYDLSFVIPERCTPLFRFNSMPPQLMTPYYLLDIESHNRNKLHIMPELFESSFSNGQRTQTMQFINTYRHPDAKFILYYVNGKNCLDEYIEPQYTSLAPMSRARSFAQKLSLKETELTLSDPIIISEIDDPSICESTTNSCTFINPDPSSPREFAELGITQPPTIRPLVSSYTSIINQSATYTVTTQPASDSYYQKYEWDFDNDGQPDETTDSPSITHAYSVPYTGDIVVTATSDYSSQTAVATIHENALASYSPSPRPLAPKGVAAVKTSASDAFLSWEPADTIATAWHIRVDGYPLAELDGDRRNVTVGDLDFLEPVTFSVSAVGIDGHEGPQTSATIMPGKSVNDSTLNRTGDEDVDKLITAYRLGQPVPPPSRTLLSVNKDSPSTKNLSVPSNRTKIAQPKAANHSLPLFAISMALASMIGVALYVFRKFKP